MATELLKCAAHGKNTRLTCVECGEALCPQCLVRTEVGLKCARCAQPVAPMAPKARTWRRPALLAGGGLVVLAALVFALAGSDPNPRPEAPKASVGSWAAVPDLAAIRGTTVVVPLGEGKVLAAGGGVSAIPLSAAEIYDVAGGGWRRTGDLTQARRGHQGVVLQDGRVLVVGGIAEGELLASAETYDPAAGVWQPTNPMTTARLGHSLTVLGDGRVLAAGGTTPKAQQASVGGQTIRADSSAEIYDPATGQWTAATPMGSARFEHTATLLDDGRVLIVGGLGAPTGESAVSPLGTAELYDPAAGVFVGSGRMAEGRTNHASVRLLDGSVVVIGGAGGAAGDVSLASAERYDPRRGTWVRVEAMSQPRSGASATLLTGGRVLVAGGEAVERGVRRSLATSELFDPAGTWRPAGKAGKMACPRSEQAAVALPGGVVLVVAGDASFPGEPPIAQGCAELYRP